MRARLPILAALVLSACAPSTGTGDAATPDALERDASPDAPAQLDVIVDVQPGPDALPDARPDALTCATDMDRDGYIAASCGGDDCDDANSNAHPGIGALPSCGDPRPRDLNCNGQRDSEESQEQRSERCNSENVYALAAYSQPGGIPPLTGPARCTTVGSGVGETRCRACWNEGREVRCACWWSGMSMRASPCD